MQHANVSQIIEQAKQHRAEYIGSAVRNHPIATLLIVGIPVLLSQVEWSLSAPVAKVLTHLSAIVV